MDYVLYLRNFDCVGIGEGSAMMIWLETGESMDPRPPTIVYRCGAQGDRPWIFHLITGEMERHHAALPLRGISGHGKMACNQPVIGDGCWLASTKRAEVGGLDRCRAQRAHHSMIIGH
jgi:hypothetical protein